MIDYRGITLKSVISLPMQITVLFEHFLEEYHFMILLFIFGEYFHVNISTPIYWSDYIS